MAIRNLPASTPWRHRLFVLIFESNTRNGKVFDIALLIAILISVLTVLLESVSYIRDTYGSVLRTIEWVMTIAFTLEYILRIISVKKPIHYVLSFMGLIDLLSILPTYMSAFAIGSQYLLSIRILRMIRVFRVLKLARFVGEQNILRTALYASRYKITVFLVAVLSLVTVMGSLLYIIEGPENGYTSIPKSMYWAIVTLTTVGYGDISPQTPFGQFLASVIMILGYGVLAVPTGIVSVELNQAIRNRDKLQVVCSECGEDEHTEGAVHCQRCGHKL